MVTKFAVGLGLAIIIAQFLIQHTRLEVNIPWQIRTYVRILTIAIFLYMINMGIILFIPDSESARLKIFTDGTSLAADCIKTLLGAIIGALSVSVSKDKNLDGVPDDVENQTPSVPKEEETVIDRLKRSAPKKIFKQDNSEEV